MSTWGGGSSTDPIHESFYQKLDCPLKQGVNYSFSYFVLGFYTRYGRIYTVGAGVDVWLCDDKITQLQRISHIDATDTFWRQVWVTFTPNQNSTVIQFEHSQPDSLTDMGIDLRAGIDNLSPITFDAGKNYITASISDSVIDTYKPVNLYCKVTDDTASNYTYSWSSSPAGFTSTEQNPVAHPLQTTTYIVTAHYNCGMDIRDTVKVRVNLTTLWFPLAFTPNNDGKDDMFGGLCTTPALVTPYNLQIYNRWGQRLFTSMDVSKKWDGTFNGKPMPQGTYIYNCTYSINGKTYTKQGDVELVR